MSPGTREIARRHFASWSERDKKRSLKMSWVHLRDIARAMYHLEQPSFIDELANALMSVRDEWYRSQK